MAKRRVAPIENEQVRLRLLAETDLPLTLLWRNQDDIRRWFIHSAVITPEQHRAWFEEYCRRDDDFVFLIEETQTLHRPVGQVALYRVDWPAGRAEFGRLMIGDPEARGLGLARQATGLLLAAAFEQFHLTEVYLEVFKDNSPAVAVYRRCGFTETGERDNLLVMRLFNPKPEREY